MIDSTEQTRKARVLFDEGHSESWSIRAEVAQRMQASHPADASLAVAAEALAKRDFEVAAKEFGPIDAATLASTDVLVIAHPSEPEWEATTGVGEPRLARGVEIAVAVRVHHASDEIRVSHDAAVRLNNSALKRHVGDHSRHNSSHRARRFCSSAARPSSVLKYH